MGVDHMVITVTSQQQMIDADTFLREAQRKWPGCRAFRWDPATHITDAAVNVRPTEAPPSP
ncbi:hypothetical protein [Actinomyces lilanjuaniae]|uniref:hypothetical protein n=1 Tax=Actinomyces lilanjuaniae TaxID=2321394 RepID=UPI001969819E|nr:hypothetical protein [Actinomyces lilanjuaniae]